MKIVLWMLLWILGIILFIVWRLGAPPEWHNVVWLAAIVGAIVWGIVWEAQKRGAEKRGKGAR
jgi:hypothetical protein